MGEEEYFVAMRNSFSQPSWSCYKSKAAFERFYAGMMQDGSGKSIKEVYPVILYQGTSQAACQQAWDDDMQKMTQSPSRLSSHFRAELGDTL